MAEAVATPYSTLHLPSSPAGAGHHGMAWAVQPICIALLVATVAFNPALALVNAHLRPVTGSMVAAAQASLELGALAIGALAPGKTPWRWIAMAWLTMMALIAIAAIRAALDAKAIGDALLIPAFIMLGMRMSSRALAGTLVWVQAALLIVGIWELASPASFGALFKVASYYVNSRGYDANAFWAGGELFLSSERPHGRILLAGLGLHRGSSLFLEPVSLGNWSIVATIATAALWKDLGWRRRLFMAASTVALLIICDGRLALWVTLMLWVLLPFARWVPGWLSVFYLPAIAVALFVARGLGYLTTVADSFSGRLRYGTVVLQQLDLEHLLGIAPPFTGIDDAGWADLIQNQSIFVAIGSWLLLTLSDTGRDPAGRACRHGIALFITLCLPISNSILSIKTAGMMWACYGLCFARAQSRKAQSTDP